MSQSRLQQARQHQETSSLLNLKPPRPLRLSGKPGDILVSLTRIGIFLCLLVPIILALYSAFSHPSSRWFLSDHIRASTTRHAPPSSDDALPPTNLSHILFGIAGSENTWHDRCLFSTLWWSPNSTRGFAWLERKPLYNFSHVVGPTIPIRISDRRWTMFDYVHSQSAIRIARLVKESFRLGLPDVRWLVMGDDDTVFFPHNLVTVLARYDHREMLYIGDNSESIEQNEYHGYAMAYGGGGFAISIALAAQLSRIFDGCLRRYYYFYGSDQRVWACVNELGVSLTKERGFHQLDIRGDPYGILAAHPITPLLSLHHLDMLEPIFPNLTQVESIEKLMSAYHVDPSRTLQQCFCYDHNRKWSVSVSWGYTVQLYATLWAAKDLQTPFNTFRTWGTFSNGPFTFNTRPMGQNPCDRPVIYFLDQVREMGNGTWSLSSYSRYTQADPGKCKEHGVTPVNVTRVRVAALKLHPSYWKNVSPRRQCCQIMDNGNIRNGTLRVRIRGCGSQEAITAY